MNRSTRSLLCFLLPLLLAVPVAHTYFLQSQLHAQILSTEDEEDEDSADEENADDPNDPAVQGIIGNQAGVSINALDSLRRLATTSLDAEALRRAAQPAVFPARTPARELRKVSLPRLERVAAELLASGADLSEEMRYLAGLTRVDYLFLYPGTGEVVIAGPASNWRRHPSGDVLSTNTRQPVLRLEDLIVALRAFPATGPAVSEIACSIDPTQEGLARMQSYIGSIARRPPAARTIVAGLKKSLGQQKVTVQGVPHSSRFARVLVEADYRMKLIGIGLETPAVPIKSYVSLAHPRSSQNAMARWYFTPHHDCVRLSTDGYALQLLSRGVRLVSEAELVAENGQRTAAARRDRASEGFARDFSRKYAALAQKEPIYAELQNLVDLSLTAAAMHVLDAYAQCAWGSELFLDDSLFELRDHSVPRALSTAANAVWKGKRLLTPVGGGVSIRPMLVLQPPHAVGIEGQFIERPTLPVELRDEQWWWD